MSQSPGLVRSIVAVFLTCHLSRAQRYYGASPYENYAGQLDNGQLAVIALPYSSPSYDSSPSSSSYYYRQPYADIEPWTTFNNAAMAPDSPALALNSLWLDPVDGTNANDGPTYVVEPLMDPSQSSQSWYQPQVRPIPTGHHQAPPPPAPPSLKPQHSVRSAAHPSSADRQTVRLVAPPTKLTATCPPSYLCCGDLKHYDPHQQLHCCGNQAFVPTQQYCTDGKSQYYVLPNNTVIVVQPPGGGYSDYGDSQYYYAPANNYQQQHRQQQDQPAFVYAPAVAQPMYRHQPHQQFVDYMPPPPAPMPYYPSSPMHYDSIRLVQPPTPLAPACPAAYTCCEGVKHYDPHNAMTCCGALAYMSATQFCSDGAVVDLVPAAPPQVAAPPPIYVQKVTLICEGIRWEVPYPNYQCCGPSVYNVAKEACSSDGLIEGRTAPPPTTTTTTEVPTRLLVCQGHRFLIPAYDFQFYACCSNDPYFWPRESCLNGAVSPARPSTTTTSATPQEVQVLLVCDGIQHWIPATERMVYGCCGQDLYDLRTDICRPPISPSGSNGTLPGQGASSSCPNGYVCCEDYPPVLNSNNVLQCCPGIGPYDPRTSACPTAGTTANKKK